MIELIVLYPSSLKNYKKKARLLKRASWDYLRVNNANTRPLRSMPPPTDRLGTLRGEFRHLDAPIKMMLLSNLSSGAAVKLKLSRI